MKHTPRTDSVCTYGDDGEWAVAYKGLCEILERENAELLAALKDIASEVTMPIYDAAGGVMDTGEEPAYDRHTMQQIARAAIAKAEGK